MPQLLTTELMEDAARYSRTSWYWTPGTPNLGVHWDRSRQMYTYNVGCVQVDRFVFSRRVLERILQCSGY
jgi:hypothetical protein